MIKMWKGPSITADGELSASHEATQGPNTHLSAQFPGPSALLK